MKIDDVVLCSVCGLRQDEHTPASPVSSKMFCPRSPGRSALSVFTVKGPLARLSSLCRHCGQSLGEHRAQTFACPVGRKTRIGSTSFSKTHVFSPK